MRSERPQEHYNSLQRRSAPLQPCYTPDLRSLDTRVVSWPPFLRLRMQVQQLLGKVDLYSRRISINLSFPCSQTPPLTLSVGEVKPSVEKTLELLPVELLLVCEPGRPQKPATFSPAGESLLCFDMLSGGERRVCCEEEGTERGARRSSSRYAVPKSQYGMVKGASVRESQDEGKSNVIDPANRREASSG